MSEPQVFQLRERRVTFHCRYEDTSKYHDLLISVPALAAEHVSIQKCSKPGCGYPDGKPCIGCGLIVTKETGS